MTRDRAKLALLAGFCVGTALLIASQRRREHRSRKRDTGQDRSAPERVAIVGCGFGGLEAARSLAGAPGVDLTLIDVKNHHLFQPLLYQVATAALSPADIASPVRAVLPASQRVRVLMASVSGIDNERRLICCGPHRVPFDQLVVATGSRPSYFGHNAWAAAAPALKTLEDALHLRNAILSAFERAALSDDPAQQAKLLTFVLIGGGPTGVEMAGAIGEIVRDRLKQAYNIPVERARILLIEAGQRILAEFTPDLSAQAGAQLRSLGVELRTGAKVTNIEAGLVHIGPETIAAHTVIWAAGMTATPVASWLGLKPGHGGRVEVGPDLRVPGHDNIFVIGDASLARDAQGHSFPGLAPVAKQQGNYVARAILRRLRGERDQAPFRYRDYGMLATIGRNKAVAQFGSVHLSGFPAWLLWAGVHIAFLISFRSRVLVALEWAFAYATNSPSAGLVIADDGSPDLPLRPPPDF